MSLTPIPPDILPRALRRLGAALSSGSPSGRALAAIAASARLHDMTADTPRHRADALALVGFLGMTAIDEAPSAAYSWDGAAVRTRSEACVLIHECAHWQVAPPDRRCLPDFGLGAGPETGRVDDANAACRVGLADREREELLASLLGILWEAALGHPAILAFVDQNWLEGWDRPAAVDQFDRTVRELHGRGLVGEDGLPAGWRNVASGPAATLDSRDTRSAY